MPAIGGSALVPQQEHRKPARHEKGRGKIPAFFELRETASYMLAV
jgi:hypothetical protein